MPSSNTDLINSALQNALGKKDKEQSRGAHLDIQDQLHASSKQIFLHDIEYERSHTPQSFILKNLKSKYVTIISKNGKNGLQNSSLSSLKSTMAQNRSEDKLEDPRITLWSSDKIVLGWRKSFPPGAGFLNLGNTCYMNSSLQALFHIPSMANWLLEEISTHIPSCEMNTQNASFCSICSMMRTLRTSLDRGNNVIKPSLIHNKLKCIGKTLMYGRQEDAHEFIKLLLDHMEKSFLHYKRALKLDHRSKETTPLNQIFGGYLRQQVICPLCCYVSTTFSHFQDLVLDIRSVASVDEALGLYFRKETLDSDNAYKCEKCRKKVPATKRHLIERTPNVLLLQLKRFTMSGGKISKHINIQKTIDLSKYVNTGGAYLYRLVSMVIHIGGSQHGGHYTAVAEASNNTMFEFDDSSVRSISVQNALMRNPYILFYELIRKPKDASLAKQVIRQNSEKVLFRQNSTEKIPKHLPTSLSTNSMFNRMGSTTDSIGEAANRSPLLSQNKKSPLPNQKERDRISFGIKTHSNSVKVQDSVSHSKSNGPSHSKGNSHTTTLSNAASNGKNGRSPCLVPYNDDSDESSEGKECTGVMSNGVAKKVQENKHARSQELTNGKKSNDKNGKVAEEKFKTLNGTLKVNGKTFLPRSLQVHPHGSGKGNAIQKAVSVDDNCVNETSNGHKEKISKVSQSLDSSEQYQNKTDNGWVVTTESEKETKIHLEIREKANQCNGWTIVSQSKRPDLEKSLSNDSVLLYKNKNGVEKFETASLKSKDSLDSGKSDKSGKSMKKSLFSLFPCVSSTQNRDLSPDNESFIGAVEDKVSSPIRSDVKSKSNSRVENTARSRDGNEDDETDDYQSKRNRDQDEHEQPSSPFKKCRPEGKRKNDSHNEDSTSVSPTDRLQNSDTNENENSNSNHTKSPPNGSRNLDSLPTFENKNGKNNLTGEEQNFSMEEKKSRHKRKRELSEEQNNSNIGTYKYKPHVHTVEWNRNIKDLSDNLSTSTKHMTKSSEDRSSTNGAWNGSNDLTVVRSLKTAGEWRFGSKVNTWDGGVSLIDAQNTKEKRETLKRTSDDFYNEELDEGRVRKHRKHESSVGFDHIENPFQKYQDNFLNNSGNSSSGFQSHKNGSSYYHNNNGNNRKFGHSAERRNWHSSNSSQSQNNYQGPFYSYNRNRPKNWNRHRPGDSQNFSDGRKGNKFHYKS